MTISFRIGGNSILTIQLKNKIGKLDAFRHIGIADLFKHNTIKKLVASILQDDQTVYRLQNNIGERAHDHEVAIIDVSGAFTGVNDIAGYWQLDLRAKGGHSILQ